MFLPRVGLSISPQMTTAFTTGETGYNRGKSFGVTELQTVTSLAGSFTLLQFATLQRLLQNWVKRQSGRAYC
jgi:hypothetical protein